MGLSGNPVIYLTKKMWEFSEGNRFQVVLYFALFFCARFIDFLRPLIIVNVLNILQTQGLTADTIDVVIGYVSLFLFNTLGFWAFHGPARYLEEKNALLAFNNYKTYLLKGTMALPAAWHADHHSGKTIDKIEKATEALFDYSSEFSVVIETATRLIGSYLILIYFNIHASYIVLGMIILTVYLIFKFDAILVPQFRRLNRADNRISEKVFDVLSNISTVMILRIEKSVLKTIVKKLVAPVQLFIKKTLLNRWKWFSIAFCGSLMTFLVLSSYLLSVYLSGTVIVVGTLYALYEYVQRIGDIFFNFADQYSRITIRRTRVENVEDISNLFRDEKEVDSVKLSDWHELKVENLNFSYHHGKEAPQHLENISLMIKRNERVAFVGASGSGKTTFMKIIRDLYHPKQANIYLDGKLLAQGFASISESISLIPQEPELFTSTIKENITLGVPYTPREIRRYTDMARFTEVVARLPKKLMSHIHEKGVNLSGGEKQRLALARGLLASEDKSIVLFDEPTSSVDLQNEALIYNNIFSKFKDKTIISSIHRLHLLPQFDRIYFFKDGKILASGTFEELLSICPEFKSNWDRYIRTQKF